jgi:hypothetical protein
VGRVRVRSLYAARTATVIGAILFYVVVGVLLATYVPGILKSPYGVGGVIVGLVPLLIIGGFVSTAVSAVGIGTAGAIDARFEDRLAVARELAGTVGEIEQIAVMLDAGALPRYELKVVKSLQKVSYVERVVA